MLEPKLIILIAFCLLAFPSFYFWIRYWVWFVFKKAENLNQSEHSADLPPLSVIVAARNEEDNLRAHLQHWMEQDYPNFELILVNDCSSDDSWVYLEEQRNRYPNLKIVTLYEEPNHPKGKKFALTMGIKAAAQEHLVFIDADCIPASKNWLRYMASGYYKKKEIVLGFGGFTQKSGMLNKFQQFETVQTALNYLSFANGGNPYMGVGRNLSYKKDMFFNKKGFIKHINHPSGDDDLFVNQNSTRKNTSIRFHPESFTISEPKATWSDWKRQKVRHVSSSKFYKGKHKIALFWNAAALYLLLTATIGAAFLLWPLDMELFYTVIGVGAFLLLLRWISIGLAAKKLKSNNFVVMLPLIDLVFPILQLKWITTARMQKQRTW